MARFDDAVGLLLRHEGGYIHHPSDPGGPTKYGITIHDFRRFIDARGTADDVRRLTVAQAKRIYRERYWNALACERLPAGIDYAVFDYGVNSGVLRAGKALRRSLKLSDGTHQVTPEVVAAARAAAAPALIAAICGERMHFLRGLPTWPVFGAGWSRRVNEVRTAALAMTRTRSAEAGQGAAAMAAGAAAAGGVAAQQGCVYGASPSVVAGLVLAGAALVVAVWLCWRR